MVKNPLSSAGDAGDTVSIPRSGRSPGEGNGNPLQYSCLEKPMDRGDRWAAVHRVTKNQTWLKRLSTHACKKCWAMCFLPYFIVSENFNCRNDSNDDVDENAWRRGWHKM